MPDYGALLNPRSVAVIGASPDESRLRGLLLAIMLKHPYKGTIYPVSRSHREVMGLEAYASIAHVPGPVDLALLAIPSHYVAEELERCGEAGVKAALIITSGFAEQSGEDGCAMQAHLAEIAARHDMAVLGPNSEGFANTHLALAATFSPAMNGLDAPLLPPWHREGRVAVVAQSGAVGFSFFDRGRPKELPFRYVVTTGNEAGAEIFDLVDYMLDEGKTDVFLLFMEDIKTPGTFTRVAEKALKLGKPLIAAKLGRSQAAVRATASHTGALAGDYAAYEAMFAAYGIITGEDAEAMVDIAAAFLHNRDRLPLGRRIGICTGSGGAGAWLADACFEAGLEVPELDAKARERIDAYLPAYGTSQNPVDGTAQAIRQIGYAELARLVAKADNVDGVIMVTSARKKNGYERERDNVFKVGKELAKPIVCWSYTHPHETSVALFAQAGMPLTTSPRNAALSIAALADYRAFRENFLKRRVPAAGAHPGREKARAMLRAAGPALCEYEAKRLLALYGIGSAAPDPAKSAGEAAAIAAKLGEAVALKIQSPDIPHKSDAGGVKLNLFGADAVRDGYDAIIGSVRIKCPDAGIRGVLVEPMAAPGVEMILGVNRDAKFGPLLLAGLGGIHVEIFRDVALAPVPLDEAQAKSLIGRLKGAAILKGVRGAPPSDMDALARTIVALSRFAADMGDEVAEIDLNPVIVHPQGKGVTVTDALIVKHLNEDKK